jgi:aldose 1-epimerase
MAITVNDFGINKDGKIIKIYTITNGQGASIQVSDMGAVWVSAGFPDKNGHIDDVILGFECGEEYELRNYVGMGAIIGRNANRISNHAFVLNGVRYELADNARGFNLHSGPDYYGNRIWDSMAVDTELGEGVEFTLMSPHMDQGFPGNLQIRVTYILAEDNSVMIEYSGVSDEDTVVNMTNHAYFNLAGHTSGKIYNHKLWIDSDFYTIGSDKFAVDDTSMDFRQLKRIGEDIENDEILRDNGGYDHNYCLKTNGEEVSLVAKVVEENSGRVMNVFTDMPGMQFYTGNFLWEGNKGKDGMSYNRGDGFALETQHYPDAINNPQFPTPVVRAGEEFCYNTIYQFTTIEEE